MRATVPRMKDNGKGLDPAGDLALGTYEADEFQGHWHQAASQSGSSGTNNVGTNTGGNAYLCAAIATDSSGVVTTGNPIIGTSGTPRTGSETRAKSTILNAFIRIN
jgi:hypothetical protein